MKKTLLIILGLCFQSAVLCAQTPDWQHIPGPDGGTLLNFDLDGATLYGLSKAGVYRSTDEGYHWELTPPSLNTTRDKRQLRVENGIFYALNSDGALLRSDDQGASWTPILQKPFPQDYPGETLQQVFVKGDTLLVGSRFTIYRSTDRGETWTSTADIVPAAFVSIFEYKNEFFAAQDRYIYRSSDRGLTWETVFTNSVGYNAVFATDSFLYAFYGNRTRMIRSANGLRSWKVVDTDTIAEHIYENGFGRWVGGSGNNLYYFELMDHFFYCPVRFCYSEDAGNTWHLGNHGEHARIGWKFYGGVAFKDHLLLGSDQLQHTLDNGYHFFEAQEGLKTGSINQIIHQGASIFSNTNWWRVQASNNGGASWSPFPRPVNWEESCHSNAWYENTQKTVFRYESGPEVIYSTDDFGSTWDTVITPQHYFSAVTDHALWMANYFWETTQNFFVFWKRSDEDPVFKPIHLADLESEPFVQMIYGMGDKLVVEFADKYWIYDENGNKILELPASPCVNAFSWNGELYYDGNTFYNFCFDRCYIFPPNATEWQEIYPQDWTTGIPLYHSNRTFFKAHDGVIWIGLEGKGLFYATDNSGRFYPAEPQMPYPYPTSISFDEKNVWVGTDGGGIWTYPLAKTLSGPTDNSIFKAFPNPSSGELNLQSESFIQDEIHFSILDASGRRVLQKLLSPGQYWSLNFPGLPKGLYFLQIRTESAVFGLKWVVDY